jgi:ankyrin repeat protein
VTNLDFAEYLLEAGADPNIQDQQGRTSLIYTMNCAPGAAKFLLNWPTTDINITTETFLDKVPFTITDFAENIAHPDNPEQLQHQFLLQQWIQIEDMLVKRGARHIGNE